MPWPYRRRVEEAVLRVHHMLISPGWANATSFYFFYRLTWASAENIFTRRYKIKKILVGIRLNVVIWFPSKKLTFRSLFHVVQFPLWLFTIDFSFRIRLYRTIQIRSMNLLISQGVTTPVFSLETGASKQHFNFLFSLKPGGLWWYTPGSELEIIQTLPLKWFPLSVFVLF